jgi:YbbR domain-containing protein
MRGLVRRVFLDDALLKAVALVLAMVLFFVVRSDKDAPTATYARVIYDPLPANRVLVSDPVTEVRLGIRGPWTRVNRLNEGDIGAITVDLTRAGEGDYSFTETMIKLPVGLRLVSITPPSVKLHFEPRTERILPVQPILEGEPASGFRVTRSEAHPREVRVIGAKSVVEGLQRARTQPLRITDARTSLHDNAVQLEPPPPHAHWDSSQKVSVDVEIAAVLAEKTLRGVAILVTGATKLEARPEPAQSDVVLRGPAEALALVGTGSPSLLIDAQAEDMRPPGTYRKRISVVGLPPGVAAEVRPETITLITKRRRE